jgi:hypothetical protein
MEIIHLHAKIPDSNAATNPKITGKSNIEPDELAFKEE